MVLGCMSWLCENPADWSYCLLSLFHEKDGDEEEDVFDMAQMTMGCGRRADSLKLALSWVYYGRRGYQGAHFALHGHAPEC